MSKKILVAEDSSVILNLTKKILEQLQYHIDVAKNGEEVLKRLETETFDLILMDINMPKVDGMECTKMIRALDNKEKASTPIFAVTGNARNYSIDEFEKVGINEFLQKPLDFDLLVKLVSEYTS